MKEEKRDIIAGCGIGVLGLLGWVIFGFPGEDNSRRMNDHFVVERVEPQKKVDHELAEQVEAVVTYPADVSLALSDVLKEFAGVVEQMSDNSKRK